jgi:hypothetical protein
MYARCRQLSSKVKLACSIYSGSTMLRQVETLKDYDLDIEVCVSIYIRYGTIYKRKEDLLMLKKSMNLPFNFYFRGSRLFEALRK